MTYMDKFQLITELCQEKKKHDPLTCSRNYNVSPVQGKVCDCKADGWNWLRSKINKIIKE